jgi:hypothetical protein
VARLNKDLRQRLDNIMSKHFTVIVGDANGADKAVQGYLARMKYDQVIVYCMAGNCRNNLGNWPTRSITAAPGARGFDYYAAKDRVMAVDADYGLMLWDGRSRGTLTNVVDLVHRGKPVVVYVAEAKSFTTLRELGQLSKWLQAFDPKILPRVEQDLHLAARPAPPPATRELSLF